MDEQSAKKKKKKKTDWPALYFVKLKGMNSVLPTFFPNDW